MKKERGTKKSGTNAGSPKRVRVLPNITTEQILQRGKPVKAPEIATSLGFSEATVYRSIRSGKIPSIRIGQAIRVPLEWYRRICLIQEERR
jgi:excisionase family DNA binding protein